MKRFEEMCCTVDEGGVDSGGGDDCGEDGRFHSFISADNPLHCALKQHSTDQKVLWSRKADALGAHSCCNLSPSARMTVTVLLNLPGSFLRACVCVCVYKIIKRVWSWGCVRACCVCVCV